MLSVVFRAPKHRPIILTVRAPKRTKPELLFFRLGFYKLEVKLYIMSSTVSIPQNHTEKLTDKELERLNKARMDVSISEDEFLSRHPEL